MASKKLKKFLAAGVAAYAGSKMLGDKGSGVVGKTKEFRQSFNQEKGFKEKVMDAVNVYRKKGLNTGPGPNKSSSPADVLGGMTGFGLGEMDGAKYGKMIKANNGTMIEARGNKLARSKPTKIC
jgi:hypothetical protein